MPESKHQQKQNGKSRSATQLKAHAKPWQLNSVHHKRSADHDSLQFEQSSLRHELHIQTLTPKTSTLNPNTPKPYVKCLRHSVEEVQGQLPLSAFLASADGGTVTSATTP